MALRVLWGSVAPPDRTTVSARVRSAMEGLQRHPLVERRAGLFDSLHGYSAWRTHITKKGPAVALMQEMMEALDFECRAAEQRANGAANVQETDFKWEARSAGPHAAELQLTAEIPVLAADRVAQLLRASAQA